MRAMTAAASSPGGFADRSNLHELARARHETLRVAAFGRVWRRLDRGRDRRHEVGELAGQRSLARHAGCGERFERRECLGVAHLRLQRSEFGRIGRAALDRGRQGRGQHGGAQGLVRRLVGRARSGDACGQRLGGGFKRNHARVELVEVRFARCRALALGEFIEGLGGRIDARAQVAQAGGEFFVALAICRDSFAERLDGSLERSELIGERRIDDGRPRGCDRGFELGEPGGELVERLGVRGSRGHCGHSGRHGNDARRDGGRAVAHLCFDPRKPGGQQLAADVDVVGLEHVEAPDEAKCRERQHRTKDCRAEHRPEQRAPAWWGLAPPRRRRGRIGLWRLDGGIGFLGFACRLGRLRGLGLEHRRVGTSRRDRRPSSGFGCRSAPVAGSTFTSVAEASMVGGSRPARGGLGFSLAIGLPLPVLA